MDSGITYTLSKFADDSKMSGASDMLEPREVVEHPFIETFKTCLGAYLS